MNRRTVVPIIIIIVSVLIACVEIFTDVMPGFFVAFGAVLLISTYFVNTDKYKKQDNKPQQPEQKPKQKICNHCKSVINRNKHRCPNCGSTKDFTIINNQE